MAPFLRGSAVDWNYETVPQKNLDNKPGRYAASGRGIGGGSLINFGTLQSQFLLGS